MKEGTRTSNVQRRTLNVERPDAASLVAFSANSMFDVQCWTFDVRI